MLVEHEQTIYQHQEVLGMLEWVKFLEPERDHPKVDAPLNSHLIQDKGEEKVDVLPTIKGVRIASPTFDFMDDLSAVLEVVRTEGFSSDEDSRNSVSAAVIADSIRSIRDEASRMDSVLALDKLDTLNEELQNTRKELAIWKSEIEQQRNLIKLQENSIAILELERDLYKADNNKLKHDVQSFLSRQQEISEISSLSGSHSQADVDQSVDLQGVQNEPHMGYDESQFYSVSGAVPPYMNTLSLSAIHSMNASKNGKKIAAQGATKVKTRRSFSQYLLKRVNHRQTTSTFTNLLPPCSAKLTMSTHSSSTSDYSSLESQIRDLHRRLKMSMDLCEELRKRLATVGHYYDNVVARLQNRLACVSREKEQVETELVIQLSSLNSGREHVSRRLELEGTAVADFFRTYRKPLNIK